MLGKEIPELMKMLVKEKREEGLELKGMSNRELPKDSYVSFKDDDGYVSFMFIFMFAFMLVPISFYGVYSIIKQKAFEGVSSRGLICMFFKL